MKKLVAFQLLVGVLLALNWQASRISLSQKQLPHKENKQVLKAIHNNQEDKKEVVLREVSSLKNKTKAPKSLIEKAGHRLLELKQCYESNDCNFSKKDSRSYDLEISKTISKELEELYESIIEKNHINETISEIAREYIKLESGHIKEKCIELFSTQETSAHNLESLINYGLFYHSDKLIDHALMEIRRYKDKGYGQQIEEAFMKVLATGTPAIKQRLASNIYDFLNESNIEIYKRVLAKLPSNSLTYKYLKSSIDRFSIR